MKTFFIFMTFFISTAQAASDGLSYQLYCSGNRGRVAISVYTSGDRLFVRYNNSLGAVDFPLYEGVVTRATIPYVNIAEKELASLDYEVLVSWPVSSCEFKDQDPLLMGCGGESIMHLPKNSPVQSQSFKTAHLIEEQISNTFNIFRIRWGLVGENFHHFLAMPFDPAQCQARLKR